MRRALVLLVGTLTMAAGAAADGPGTIVRFSPDGPPGTGLSAMGRAKGHEYLKTAAGDEAGVWRGEAATFGPSTAKYSEFMYFLEGSVTLIDRDGRQETFKAGDAVLVPRGAEYTWKQAEAVQKYYVVFDHAASAGATTAAADTKSPTFMRLDPSALTGKAPAANGRTTSHRYYAGGDKSSVGVWETKPHAGDGFHTAKYAELMVFLEGAGSLNIPGGKTQPFKAGDVVLVPKGASYQWKSETVRKFWVIFDNQATATE